MFDVGWQELALTAVVALVVLGPKELPGLMRTAGALVRKARLIAHDFRMNLEEMSEEIELDDYRQKAMQDANKIEPLTVQAQDQTQTAGTPESGLPPKNGEGGHV